MAVRLAERKDVQTVAAWVMKKLVSMDQKTADRLAARTDYKSASYWAASLDNAMAAVMELRAVAGWVDSSVGRKVRE